MKISKSIILIIFTVIASTQSYGQYYKNNDLYLIIVSDDYNNSPSLSAFKTFREQDFTVQIVLGSSIGSTKDDYRNYIRNLMPSYVLLVGKYGDFPVHLIPYTAEVESYNYYVATSTTGHPAVDIPLGLFFAQNENELSNLINKTMSFETNVVSYPKVYYAHAGSIEVLPPWPVVEFNEEILTEMYDKYFGLNGYTFVMATANDSTPNDAWTDIDMINSGIRYLIYHGHGNIDKWSFGMGGSNYALSQLHNNEFPIIFSFACHTGTFSGVANGDTGVCFAQRITAAEHGAVAFFGAYNISGRGMNLLLEGAVNGLFNDTVHPRLGNVLIHAFNNEVNTNTVNLYYPTVTSFERNRAAWQFHLFGDPALKISHSMTKLYENCYDSSTIHVFPNPTNGEIQIQHDAENIEIQIHTIDGRILVDEKNKTLIDISSLPSDLYLLLIKYGDKVEFRKIIKMK
jgi:hypothetical protein